MAHQNIEKKQNNFFFIQWKSEDSKSLHPHRGSAPLKTVSFDLETKAANGMKV